MARTNWIPRKLTKYGRLLIITGAALCLAMGSTGALAAGEDPNGEYDRLDGMGASGKTVNVIEWENNLEIHVAPKGSLKGLSLALDKPDAKSGGDKLVMVIGYRFADNPQVLLIRRAILGIPITSGFKAYLDPTEDDYDKVVISNNGLSAPLALYKLETPSKQLYPDGYPGPGQSNQEQRGLASSPAAPTSRTASTPIDAAAAQQRAQAQSAREEEEDSGTIQPFFSKH